MIKIVTENCSFKDSEVVETYNEIHEILGLQGLKHILATIESIVRINKKYNKNKLVSITVSVSFTNKDLLNNIISHYSDNPIDCIVKPGLYLLG